MLVQLGPGLLRVPGEAQLILDYIVATRSGSVRLSEGPSQQLGNRWLSPTSLPLRSPYN